MLRKAIGFGVGFVIACNLTRYDSFQNGNGFNHGWISPRRSYIDPRPGFAIMFDDLSGNTLTAPNLLTLGL